MFLTSWRRWCARAAWPSRWEDIKQILFNTKEIRGTQENVLYIGVISSYWHFLYLLCERYVALSLSLHA